MLSIEECMVGKVTERTFTNQTEKEKPAVLKSISSLKVLYHPIENPYIKVKYSKNEENPVDKVHFHTLSPCMLTYFPSGIEHNFIEVLSFKVSPQLKYNLYAMIVDTSENLHISNGTSKKKCFITYLYDARRRMWLMFDNNSQCSKEWTKKFPELKKDQVRLIMYERNGVESMFISEERSQSSWQEQIMFIDCTNVKNTCAELLSKHEREFEDSNSKKMEAQNISSVRKSDNISNNKQGNVAINGGKKIKKLKTKVTENKEKHEKESRIIRNKKRCSGNSDSDISMELNTKLYKPNHLINSKGKKRSKICPKIAMNESQSRLNNKKVLNSLMSRSTWIKELATKSKNK